MIDKEKVIKGLEEAETMLAQAVDRGGEMSVIGAFNCLKHVTDTLALLKEQELVRCKDCKHFRKEEKAMVANQYCSNLHRAVTNDWFCADGNAKS